MATTRTTAKGALQAVINGSGKSRRAVSIELGFHENTLANYSNKGMTPGLSLMARIAGACGYQLQLVKGDEVIVIDPEEGES